MNKHYGFWLLFEKDDESKLTTIINELSNTYLNGEVFVPHLSIFPSIQIELDKLVSILEDNFQEESTFQVSSNGIEYENRWSKTLYVDINRNDKLVELNTKLEDIFEEKLKDKNDYHPHVSLIYKEDLASKVKEKLKREYMSQIPDGLTITSLGIVDPGVEGYNWRDFTKWRIVKK